MDMKKFVATVQKYAGSSEKVASQASSKTLEVLGELLTRRDREVLATHLPDRLRSPLFARSTLGNGSTYDVETFYEKVVVQENADGGFHLEHAQAVCMALGEVMDQETGHRIRARLPKSIAELLEPREIPDIEPTRRHDISRKGRKLSAARPGSSRSLSTADYAMR